MDPPGRLVAVVVLAVRPAGPEASNSLVVVAAVLVVIAVELHNWIAG